MELKSVSVRQPASLEDLNQHLPSVIGNVGLREPYRATVYAILCASNGKETTVRHILLIQDTSLCHVHPHPRLTPSIISKSLCQPQSLFTN